MSEVSIVKCDNYESAELKRALTESINAIGGLDMIKPGMTVGIKLNLVAGAKPEKAVTTHPAAAAELVKLLKERGAKVICGDSPGGLYNSIYVNRIYSVSGMKLLEKAGAELNSDFSEKNTEYPNAKVLKDFRYTAWLDKCDVIINFCKLKTHGMMGMSAAAKNMFGTIPGTLKPEYHFRFPDYEKFAAMIVDIDEYFKPVLSIVDAVEGMEGNGPTMGTPRHIGAIIASASPHKADLVCAEVIGQKHENLPILNEAILRGLCPDDISKLDIYGNVADFKINDYQNITHAKSMLFKKENGGILANGISGFIQSALRSRPKLEEKDCIGCGICCDICPANAIKIEDKKPVINKNLCITCFCCQEFCPKGAMKVYRPLIARILADK